MSLWRQVVRGVDALVNRARADRDSAEEVEHYLEQLTADFVSRGLSPAAARRAARLEAGSAASLTDQLGALGWEHAVSTALSDVRYAARRLRHTPSFTVVAVLTLAIGIGASTAIFSAIDPILLEPLPYPDASRVFSVVEQHLDGSRTDGTFAMYRELSERARALAAIAVYRTWRPAITGGEQPERLDGQRVSGAYFAALGVAPAIGRAFSAEDDRVRGPRVVILSDSVWRRRFNADAAIVGREIRLDDSPYTVIGVMGPAFENVVAPSAAVWTALQYDPALPPNGREWGHHLGTVARLRPDAAIGAARSEIAAVGAAFLTTRRPETYDPNTRLALVSLQDDLTRAVKPALLAIAGAVLLVLVIASVNVTNLLLARGVQRRGEFALRNALGAGRARLVRQLLTESLMLALAGGACGMVVAIAGVRAFIAITPPGLPRSGAIHVDATMFVVGLLTTLVIGAAVGSIPALQAGRQDVQSDLQHASRRMSGGHRRLRAALVIAEVALALVLLVGSGLLMRSLGRLFTMPLGFDSAGVLTMQVQLVGRQFAGDSASRQFFEQALDAVRRVPGVAGAGFTTQLPLSGDRDEYGAHFDATATQAANTYGVFRYAVTPGYLETLGVPLLSGRLLGDRDTADAPRVAVISQALAKERFGRGDPLGQLLRIGPSGPYTIVGVVGDVTQLSLAATEAEAVYLTEAQSWFADTVMSLVVRAHGDPALLAPAVRQAVWSVNKDQPIVRVETMTTLIAASEAQRRFALIVFETFGLASVLLAAIGIYGVLAGSVTERTREIGVRAALGASRRDVIQLVVTQGLRLTVLGVLIGSVVAAGASGALATLLFGVSRLDPVTYAGVIAMLLGASIVACGVPAWRAARVDPAITLRQD